MRTAIGTTTTMTLMCLSSVSCGTFVDATYLNDSPKPLRVHRPGEVEVYASAPPKRPHVDVALLTVEQTESLNEQGTALMIRRLREKAAEMGCDAVFISGRTERDGAQPGSGWDLLDPGSHSIHATCVVYSDDAEADYDPRRDRPRVAHPSTANPLATAASTTASNAPVLQATDNEDPTTRSPAPRGQLRPK